MPTDPSGGADDRDAEAADDQLTFAVHDLGRERGAQPDAAELGFVAARPTAAPPPEPARPTATAIAKPVPDGFVIREPQDVAPSAPVDALVVGAPEPAPAIDEPAAGSPAPFRVGAATAVRAAHSDELWTTRHPAAAAPAAPAIVTPSRRGWSMRHSELVDRSAHATMLRLREEAVNVSWKSAWLAVTACDPRLLRRRAGDLR